MKREVQEEHNESLVKEHLRLAVNVLEQNRLLNSKVVKLNDFYNKKSKGEKWSSPSFYTPPGGYRMMLSVYANGQGSAHISCYIHVLAGKYDDNLEWPFQGEVTIELLNQLEDNNHKACIVKYDESTPDSCKNRIFDGTIPQGCGYAKFVPHSELGHNTDTNCCYLLNDCLHFRITVKVASNTKPWLYYITK